VTRPHLASTIYEAVDAILKDQVHDEDFDPCRGCLGLTSDDARQGRPFESCIQPKRRVADQDRGGGKRSGVPQ
jgi:hypothetical protein